MLFTTGAVIDVAFITDGDISVIYDGQDVSANYGYRDTSKRIEKRQLVIDGAYIEYNNDNDKYHVSVNCRDKQTNQKMSFLAKYIINSHEWQKKNL